MLLSLIMTRIAWFSCNVIQQHAKGKQRWEVKFGHSVLLTVPSILSLCTYMMVTRNIFKGIKHKPNEDFEFCWCSVDSAVVIWPRVTFAVACRQLGWQQDMINGEKE